MRGLLGLLVILLLLGCAEGPFEGYKYKPYSVRGQRYIPISPEMAPGYVEEGIASHYNESFLFFPGPTALGEKQWPWRSAGAHKTLPLPCRVRVTNLNNGRSTVVRLNDRGPYIAGRSLDVTEPVAKKLGFHHAGLTRVRIEVLSVGDGRWKLDRPLAPRAVPVPAGESFDAPRPSPESPIIFP